MFTPYWRKLCVALIISICLGSTAIPFTAIADEDPSGSMEAKLAEYKEQVEGLQRAMQAKDAKFIEMVRVLKNRRVGLPAISKDVEAMVQALGKASTRQELDRTVMTDIPNGRNDIDPRLAPEAHRRHHRDDCDDDPGQSCALNCRGRRSDGTCYSYDNDYCGPDANCAANCVGRRSDGTCYSYDGDFCGPNAICSPNCLGRRSDGTCYSYGPDMCF